MTVTRVASITPFGTPDGTPVCEGWLGIFATPDGAEHSENTHGLALVTVNSGFYRGNLTAWAAPLSPDPTLWDWFSKGLNP
jgi:hypothetical protein